MGEQKKFYVYLLYFEDGSYYVGKGHSNRVNNSIGEHGGDDWKIIYWASDEDDAFRMEDKVWVEMVGRSFKMNNKHRPGRYGHGDERSGWKHSANSRMKMRLALTKTWLTYQGKTKPLKMWAEEFKIDQWTLRYRLSHGMAVEEALTAPLDRARGVPKMLITRGVKRITFKGVTRTIVEWSKELGIKPITIYARLYRNKPVEQVLYPGNLGSKKCKVMGELV